MRIVHRAVRCDNVLVSESGISAVKLAGLSVARDDYYRTVSPGLPEHAQRQEVGYHSPEVLQDTEWSSKADVYALGVLLWQAASFGKTPWGLMSAREIYDAVCKGSQLPQPAGCDNELCVAERGLLGAS